MLEARSREYVEQRVRAGVLEQGTVDLLKEMGVGERMERQGLVHHGVELRFAGRGHRIDFEDLTGRAITVYGQQEVVKDLIAARLDFGGPLLFEVDDVRPGGDRDRRARRCATATTARSTRCECDVIAGCDGFHGVCRDAVPDGVLTFHEREWPFAWLGHPGRGRALQRRADLRPSRARLRPAEHALPEGHPPLPPVRAVRRAGAPGPTSASGRSCELRLAGGDFHLNQGPIFERGITPMRSFVTEPMQHGRLYLAGDAVHIVPPTGAKGLNLAVADVRVLADGARALVRHGRRRRGCARYSDTCLRRVWHTQHFSWWMTSMLHRMPEDVDGFQAKLQIAQLDYVCSSRAASTSLAENYVGLDLPA